MVEKVTLPRLEQQEPAFDYAQLRSEGLSHIQKLSGLIWTDHNSHDPGITTLEVLSYALTDLAYRSAFDTRDLMTRPDGKMDPSHISGLFPAHDILTTGARTLNDYRRLLLRIEGLRNAWLDPMMDAEETDNYRLSEVPLYADCLSDSLSFSPTNADGNANHAVKLSGLYKVLIELEIDVLLGSLNETALTYQVRHGDLKGVVLNFDCKAPEFIDGSISFDADFSKVIKVKASDVNSHIAGFSVDLAIKLTGVSSALNLNNCIVSIIEDRPRFDSPAVNITAAKIAKVLSDSAEVLSGNASDGIVALFWKKQQRRASALRAVACVLHANRGLCEDFLNIDTVTPYRVALCADIEISPETDLEEVQAKVFHEVEKYLAPTVRYNTLEEMLSGGYQPDEIFNAPYVDFNFQCGDEAAKVFTKPGFITDETLEDTTLRRKVQSSDIINIIVDIEGVEAIRNLQLRAYNANGHAIGDSMEWTLKVPPGHQPVFYMEGSKLLFHKSGIPYRSQTSEFKRTLDYLRAQERREVYVAPDQTLPVPVGKWRHLDTQYSVQHDFPGTYKIGRDGISRAESAQRIAQARQFKGYLTFFDQVLADYLGQLANLRKLYSLDKNQDRTWFSQYLSGIKGSIKIDKFEEEFLLDLPTLQDDLLRTRLTETESEFQERRNRVLDHLIARFAERFADYSLMLFRLAGDRSKTSAQLIEDKIDFLSDYPKVSRKRGQACNIRPQSTSLIWDSENISGLERRIGRLLGLNDISRRNLHCKEHFTALFTATSGANSRLQIIDDDETPLFTSRQTFASTTAALTAAEKAYPDLRKEGAFEIIADQGTTSFQLHIVSGGGKITHKSDFDSEVDAVQAARAIIERYDELLEKDLCNSEGMHLIEHILLRPMTNNDKLFNVCLEEECAFCGEEDPYSFRATAVLPYWPENFRSQPFRALLERTLREEAPAHTQIKICWISQSQMIDLDKAYRAWLRAKAKRPNVPATIRTTTARLIEILETLKTVYPAAELHDCDVGENNNPVRLGASALGRF
ncbi:MAG: hypothetical protein QNK19_10885 [Xanthomonadales bacterium]|nr:hypothetical protein [Xanthomonadales bacterium]